MKTLFLFLLLLFAGQAAAQTVYLNPLTGADGNAGSAESPVRTLKRAASMVNIPDPSGPATLILAPGLYCINETVKFESVRPVKEENRLTIQAQILPEDTSWSHAAMPVIISTQMPEGWQPAGTPQWQCALQFERNHVTVKGLKFLGSPVPLIWYYPIARYGKSLTDLHVTQCAFVMDRAGVTANVGILTNGHATVIDHCLFYRCRNPVVFWRADNEKSIGNAMHHCLIHDAYTSAVWVCDTETDLAFHHNVIDGAEYVWMRDEGSLRRYRLSDCLITGFHRYSGQAGEGFSLSETGPDILYDENRVRRTDTVSLVTGMALDVPVPRFFMHIEPGTPGSELGAGLFKAAGEDGR